MEYMWISFFIIIVAVMWQKRQNMLIIILRHLRAKRGKFNMTEMINRFIGKECLIYTCNSSSTVTGTIHSYNDGWIEIETNGQCDILNCEYITRIREYPRGKNGKKKSLVLD